MGSITVRLADDIERDLDCVVQAEKTTRSEVVRDAVMHYLAVKRFRQIRKQVLPFAEAQGILTDEDVFKAVS
jgi:predicted transcriptional regulator